MIIEQIVALIKADTAIQALIDNKIYAFSAPKTAIPCVVYTPSPVADDNIKEQNKIEIRVITNDLYTGLSIDSAIRRVLLTIGDTQLTGDILQCGINGGGTLQDTASNTIQIFTYYNLINRKV